MSVSVKKQPNIKIIMTIFMVRACLREAASAKAGVPSGHGALVTKRRCNVCLMDPGLTVKNKFSRAAQKCSDARPPKS